MWKNKVLEYSKTKTKLILRLFISLVRFLTAVLTPLAASLLSKKQKLRSHYVDLLHYK